MSSSNYNKYLKEVTKSFLASGTPVSKKAEKEAQEKWFRGTKYKMYNIKRKDLKALLKNEFSFSSKSKMEIAKIWSYIFKNTEHLDMGSLAIDYFKQFQNKKTHPIEQYWPLLKTWIPHIENWVHGDMISGLYCDCLSAKPDMVYPHLLKWSKQKSPWKNRMAMLSLLYYYNPKRTLLPYKKVIQLVDPHINKDHYYLQKAVGWTLREVIKAYPKNGWSYVTKHAVQLSPTAYTTAFENIPANKKKKFKDARKKHRASLRN